MVWTAVTHADRAGGRGQRGAWGAVAAGPTNLTSEEQRALASVSRAAGGHLPLPARTGRGRGGQSTGCLAFTVILAVSQVRVARPRAPSGSPLGSVALKYLPWNSAPGSWGEGREGKAHTGCPGRPCTVRPCLGSSPRLGQTGGAGWLVVEVRKSSLWAGLAGWRPGRCRAVALHRSLSVLFRLQLSR